MPPREAIYQACLLRFRPILMTTMAAMLGALPLMLGTGTGAELRQPLGIAIVGGLICQPAADAVHHAGDLSLLRPPGARAAGGRRPPARAARARNEPQQEHLGAIHRAAGSHDAIDRGHRPRRRASASPAASIAAAAGRFPPSRCNASFPAPAPIRWRPASPTRSSATRSDRRRDRDDLAERHGRRASRPVRVSRDIDGAARDVQAAINAARADLPTKLRSNPTYRKVNPADAPILILALTSKTMTRARCTTPRATSCRRAVTVQRHRPGSIGGSCTAGGARRAQSAGAIPLRHRPRGRARGACVGERQQPERNDRRRRPALPDLHQRPGQRSRRLRRW